MLGAIGAGLTLPVGDRDWAELRCESPEFQDTIIEIERIKTEAAKKTEGRRQGLFFEICDSVLVSAESGDEEVVRGAVEVAELRVHEGLHSCGDFVDLVPLVFAIGPQREGSAVQTFLDVSVCIGGGPSLPHQDANLRPPARCWVCTIPTITKSNSSPLDLQPP